MIIPALVQIYKMLSINLLMEKMYRLQNVMRLWPPSTSAESALCKLHSTEL